MKKITFAIFSMSVFLSYSATAQVQVIVTAPLPPPVIVVAPRPQPIVVISPSPEVIVVKKKNNGHAYGHYNNKGKGRKD